MFEVKDVKNAVSERKYGVLVSNPPYGERLLNQDDVKTLYKTLGKTFFSLDKWSGYFLTSFDSFERFFGKSADRKKRLFNANLACTLYSYFGEKPKDTL